MSSRNSAHQDGFDRELLEQFIATFTRAIRLEMDAMKRRLGSFEIEVWGGRPVGESTNGHRAAFSWRARDGKIVRGIECTFRSQAPDLLVTVVAYDDTTVTLESASRLPAGVDSGTLVIYPWFLYERLIDGIGRFTDDATLRPDMALKVFGKIAVQRISDDATGVHPDLNEGQNSAVQHAISHELSFIWGPPGTGKTTTLAALIEQLVARGERVLVASTTNAAVDQVASRFVHAGAAGDGETVDAAVSPTTVRVGQAGGEAAPLTVEAIRQRMLRLRTDEIRERTEETERLKRRIEVLESVIERLGSVDAAGQMTLFGPTSQDVALQELLDRAFGDLASSVFERSDREAFVATELDDERARLAQSRERIVELRATPTDDLQIVQSSTAVLSTMSSLYVGELMRDQRFDTVVIEEAGMAVLPAVFFSAGLAARRVVCVGDPRQLPPIVQADDDYARRAMGRSIFAVRVPDGVGDPLVSLLRRQYRMHSEIAAIVSDVFYDGLIETDPSTKDTERIAACEPNPGRAVVLLDLAGASSCEREQTGSSRFNTVTAERAVDVAEEVVVAGIDSVGIITPYAAQSRLISRMLADRGVDNVECTTVHRFQGHERDCIIVDFTDAPPMRPGVLLTGEGFDSQSANLLNVSVSRARGKLILIAEAEYFSNSSECGTVCRLLDAARRADGRFENER